MSEQRKLAYSMRRVLFRRKAAHYWLGMREIERKRMVFVDGRWVYPTPSVTR